MKVRKNDWLKKQLSTHLQVFLQAMAFKIQEKEPQAFLWLLSLDSVQVSQT
jgi:hypothetical protein